MKKYLYLFLLLVIVYTNQLNAEASTSNNDEVIFYNIEEPLDVYPVNEGYLIKYEQFLLFKTYNTEIKIEGKLKCFEHDQESIFIITDNNNKTVLSKISENKVISKTLEENININKIIIDNNRLCLFGSLNEFSIIYEYSFDLEIIKCNKFFENCNIEFYDVQKYNDRWYVFGLKKGHCENSDIYNVGNYNDIKTIVFIFDLTFNIKTIKYLNFNCEKEIPTILKIDKEQIYYKIETTNYVYLYQSNLTFSENYLMLTCSISNDHLMLDVNNQYLLFYYDDSLKMKTMSETINIGNYNKVYDYRIKNGNLELIYYNKNNVCKSKIDEYHIEKLETIYISYEKGNIDFEKDLNVLDEIEIRSYFSEVSVFCNTEFMKNISGKQNIELLIKRENHEDVKLSTQVDIEKYVNIIDGGVYCTGHSLKFLGIGTLNGVKINNGHNITGKGEYKLELSDNLGNITTYRFLVVDSYYQRNQDYKSFDMIGYIDTSVEIGIYLENIEVKELYINNQKVDFNYVDGKLMFKLVPENNPGLKNYIINKIVTNESEYQINKEIIVNYLKKVPTIDILENNSNEPYFSFMIEDPNQTLKYFELKLINDNYSNSLYYCFNEDFVFEDSNFIDGTIEVYACYELGDGVIQKELICSINGNYKNLNNLLTINSIIEAERIKQVDLKINMENVSKMNNLTINNQELVNKYNVNKDFTSLIISIVLTCIVLIIFITCFIIKKKRNKQHN